MRSGFVCVGSTTTALDKRAPALLQGQAPAPQASGLPQVALPSSSRRQQAPVEALHIFVWPPLAHVIWWVGVVNGLLSPVATTWPAASFQT